VSLMQWGFSSKFKKKTRFSNFNNFFSKFQKKTHFCENCIFFPQNSRKKAPKIFSPYSRKNAILRISAIFFKIIKKRVFTKFAHFFLEILQKIAFFLKFPKKIKIHTNFSSVPESKAASVGSQALEGREQRTNPVSFDELLIFMLILNMF
jgi:hypothetical protein